MSVEYVGPFSHHEVVIDGRIVPFLTAGMGNGGVVWLTLDRRYALDLPVADADRIVEFIADAIAIGMGFTCHPRAGWDAVPLPPQPKSIGLDFLGVES